ncbi:hypothetical protein [Parvularcula sp. LCG005]|uniref:hypothetical protein n=1 Tax=Parvularcula sp. LCG005 TaxID=3078805 RepID=UPI002942F249|nr:hypothetical protein [Parvularcula sp. LCG005]WOI53922.1 hypothetical protein RUI03_02705 [Parvularcula sp. LCG005]
MALRLLMHGLRILAASVAIIYALGQLFIVIGYRFFSDGAIGFGDLELLLFELFWVVVPMGLAAWLLRGYFRIFRPQASKNRT